MADQAIVLQTYPELLVQLVDAGTTCAAGLLLGNLTYVPEQGDVVTVLPVADGSVTVLGVWSQ